MLSTAILKISLISIGVGILGTVVGLYLFHEDTRNKINSLFTKADEKDASTVAPKDAPKDATKDTPKDKVPPTTGGGDSKEVKKEDGKGDGTTGGDKGDGAKDPNKGDATNGGNDNNEASKTALVDKTYFLFSEVVAEDKQPNEEIKSEADKNYHCFSNTKTMDCDLFEIGVSDPERNMLSLKAILADKMDAAADSYVSKQLDKATVRGGGLLYKVVLKTEAETNFAKDTILEMRLKPAEGAKVDDKHFAKFKFQYEIKEEKIIYPALETFIGSVSSFKEEGTSSLTLGEKSYKCSFTDKDDKKEACEFLTVNVAQNQESLTIDTVAFDEKLEKVTQLDMNKFYVIKFTPATVNKDELSKGIKVWEINGEEATEKLTFAAVYPAFIYADVGGNKGMLYVSE